MNTPRTRSIRDAVALGSLILLCAATTTAEAQSLIAVDDIYTAPAERTLSVEPIGVLENDTDGQGENLPLTAVADLVTDVGSGTLVLSTDGSFTYTPPTGFLGEGFFTYRVLDDGLISNTATVTLTVSGCTDTSPVSTCWIESEFQARLLNLGYTYLEEGFEDDTAWGVTRSPLLAAAVLSNGITWTSNHVPNNLSTGSGAGVTGLWGVYSIPHGVTTGSPFDPQHDGLMGTSVDPLFGVGGWFDSNTGAAAIEALLTSPPDSPIVVNFTEHTLGYSPRFFGVIDTHLPIPSPRSP